MAFTKYASLEGAQILDLKGSKNRARSASLAKLGEFEDYRTEDGFLYARIRAISSRVNKNHDGWPAVELAGGSEVFDRHTSSEGFTVEADSDQDFGYSTFLGKPIFVDHHNSNPERARGVIVDAKLHVEDHKTASLDPYYSSDDVDPEHLPATWVELLLEVDAKSFPRLAKAIIAGAEDPNKGIDGFSMGCDVERSVCNICKNSATSPDDFCQHVRMKGAHFDYINPHTGKKTSKRSYENCYGIKFFEISAVFDPADETALLREVTASEISPYQAFDPQQPEGSPRVEEMDAPVECPTCHGYDPKCATCGGPGRRAIPVPGHDGAISPDQISTQRLHPPGPALQGVSPMYGKTAAEIQNVHDVLEGPPTNTTVPDTWSQQTPADWEQQIYQLMQEAPQWGQGGSSIHSEDFADILMAQGVPSDIAAQAAQEWAARMDQGGSDLTVPAEFPQYEGDPEKYLAHRIAQIITAQNPIPQVDLLHAPEEIDTLREDTVCEVCGSTMDEEKCDVCGYVEPPAGFDNPDLTKAQGEQPDEAFENIPDGELGPVEPSNAEQGTSNLQPFAHVKGEMGWKESLPSRTAARETVPGVGPATDEPADDVLEDSDKPITSHVRTAAEFIAAAGATRRTNMNHRTADAASGAPAVASPDTNTETVGVGGVMDASNEEASRADAQINVDGVGGTGVSEVSSDSTESLPSGEGDSFDTKKNIEAIPTKTFDDGSSGVERQADPVSGEPFPASEDGVKNSAWTIEGHEDGPFPAHEDSAAGDGSAVQGTQPADPVGKAQDRVDLTQPTTSPSNNSGPTTTWTGTDGNGVTRQAEPTTSETLEGSDGVKSAHIFAAFKLADLEVEIGLLPAEKKYERVAALEVASAESLQAQLEYAQRVKTAGFGRKAKTASRLPVLGRNASTQSETPVNSESNTPDEALYS